MIGRYIYKEKNNLNLYTYVHMFIEMYVYTYRTVILSNKINEIICLHTRYTNNY